MGLAVVLDQPLQHDGAGRHVDAQGQRLGGEHGPHQALDEQFLDGLPERRQHARMVGGQAALQRLAPFPVPEHLEIAARQFAGVPRDDRVGPGSYSSGLDRSRREREHWASAASQPARLKMKVIAGSRPSESSRASTSGRGGGRYAERGPRPRPRPARFPGPGPVGGLALLEVAHQFLVHHHARVRARLLRVVSNRSNIREPTRMCCHSGTGRCSSTTITVVSPRTVSIQAPNSSALLTVADRHTSAHRLGQVQDHLLPHRAAEPVGQVVHLVHDDVGQPGQGRRAGVEHVAQHLGGHHDHWRVRLIELSPVSRPTASAP